MIRMEPCFRLWSLCSDRGTVVFRRVAYERREIGHNPVEVVGREQPPCQLNPRCPTKWVPTDPHAVLCLSRVARGDRQSGGERGGGRGGSPLEAVALWAFNGAFGPGIWARG